MARVMIVGLGDLGSVILELLLRSREQFEVIVAARNVERAALRCNLALLGAIAQGSDANLRLIELDLSKVDATAEMLRRERPDLLLTTATMATWWLPDMLPERDCRAIRRAEFGVWLPVHLAPTLQLMRAVRDAAYTGIVLNAPYPDVVNHALGKVGMAPTCGIGNVAEMVPKLEIRASRSLGVSPTQVRVRFVAHHALGKHVYAEQGASQLPVPPFLLRVECDGKDVTAMLDLHDVVVGPEPILAGRVTHWLTASSAIPLIRAFLQSNPEPHHAPGPAGLPGGYPVQVSSTGLELNLGDISIEAAKAVNLKSHRFDGIDRVLDDGTVILAEENVQRLRSVFGQCADRIELATVQEQSADLVSRLHTYAASRGVRLP